ncbi:hypothetical protein KKG46_01790 [Patescibacteria group bacterium]|nr:hypothetical protein [Patescibacteria group bacterium]
MNQSNEDGLVKSNKKITGQLLTAFIVGAIFGQLLLYGLLHFVNQGDLWVTYLAYPAFIVRYVDVPLLWLCNIFNSNLCIGMGLDGGPLEWVEWAVMYTSMSVTYGLLFVIIYKIYSMFKDNITVKKL